MSENPIARGGNISADPMGQSGSPTTDDLNGTTP
jgi:hypothetical protein